MSDLTLFEADGLTPEDFGIAPDGRAYVVASKLAKAMGYRDAEKATRLLDEDEKGTLIRGTLGGDQRVSVVYEDGIWELIFRSTLPTAKALKTHVKRILRQLRETGVVDTRERPLTELERARQYVVALERVEELEAQRVIDAPKVSFFDDLVDREGYLVSEQVARALGVGRNDMMKFLRERGLLLVRPWNDPCAGWVKAGYALARPNGYVNANGRAATTTVFSPAGAERIASQLRKAGVIA